MVSRPLHIGIHGHRRLGQLAAIERGCLALGHQVTWRDHNSYSKGQQEAMFDVVIMDGIRGRLKACYEDYRKAGKVVLVQDLGFIRGSGQYQFGHGLNWLPKDAPPDRWDRLGVELKPRHRGEYIVLCGQKPGDGSHGMDEDGVNKWAARMVHEIRGHTRRPIIWRPHPKHANAPQLGDRTDIPTGYEGSRSNIEDALYWAFAVVTYNSTSGTDALIHGVPVFCDESAQYAHIGNTRLKALADPYFPDDETRLKHFHRVAYAQWTEEELSDGTALEYLLATAP